MKTCRMPILTLILYFSICVLFGCSDDSDTCTAVDCSDFISVNLSSNDTYVAGQYSAELVFSDDESIIAEFELVTTSDNPPDLSVIVVQNESYRTSWFMPEEFVDPLEIRYYGTLIKDNSSYDYEFTQEVTINIRKDGEVIVSEFITPDYDYYWCNYEYGECDDRENKSAEIDITIDLTSN